MSIEAKGAPHAYVVFLSARATRQRGYTIRMRNIRSAIFTAAHSDDEAFGIGMKVALKTFPMEHGWKDHDVLPVMISGIASVGPHRDRDITPQPSPWEDDRGS